jgi:outer membrane receptor protein involved in Fe transport
MKKILTLFVAISLSFAAKAQSGEISGTVKDEKGEGMISATIVILDASGKNTGLGTVTDFDGNYSIKPLRPGRYDVQFSYAGYASQVQKDVLVKADQPTFLNVKLNPADKVLNQVEVVAYKVPLIDRASTTNASTLDKKDIANLPTQRVEDLVSTTAGVFQEDANKGISIRGGREDGTEYYINGVKVIGTPNLPVQSIEQLTVITGGVPARYGDATGGIVNITTKGPSDQFTGGVSIQTSQGLDAFGYNQANANLLGPIWNSKKQKRTILGFSAAFEFLDQRDQSPSAIGVWQVKGDVLDRLNANPIYRNPSGTNFIYSAENLTFQDLYKAAAKPDNERRDYKGVLMFDLSPANGVNIAFGGDVGSAKYRNWVNPYTLLNSENNPTYTDLNYRFFGRFTHNVSSTKKKKEGGEEEKSSAVQNVFYALQFDYEKFQRELANNNYGKRFFEYGYVGKFETEREASYSYRTESIGGIDYTGWIQNGSPQAVSVAYTPGESNPLAARFTEQYYQLLGAERGADGAYRVLDPAIRRDFTDNLDNIGRNRALINGGGRVDPIYDTWFNFGRPFNSFSVDRNDEQMRGRAEVSFDILKPGSASQNKHSIEFGIEVEQRTQRSYNLNPLSLWGIARNIVQNNTHIFLDTSSAIVRINGQDYNLNDPNRPDFYFTDTLSFGYKADLSKQGAFDRNLRKAMGLDPNGTDYIDIDALSVDKLSVNYFAADELLRQFSVAYRGYDHKGNVLNFNPTLDDFFKRKDEDGNFLRYQGAFRPIYASAYVSDKFYFKDLGFMVGLRVDRFDANQSVLKDPYSLYEVKTKGEVKELDGNAVAHPESIGDDYAVYVTKYGDGSSIAGYRKGDNWYDKFGNLSTGRAIANLSSEGALPYVNLPGIDTMSTAIARGFVQTNPDDYDPSVSFTRYKAQYLFMPRLQFSFNITDNAQFFAHYDILSQRPQGRNQLVLSQYLFWSENGAYKTNPNLKPETTIDYEFGFKQKVTKSSVVTLSAYYKEFRNMIQARKLLNAFPSTYYTFDNIDFVSVKGFNLIYDMRRTGNFRVNANYTLQFAEGTGSDDGSQQFLVDADVPNLRTIFPVNYDARHLLNITLDYRFAEGKDYNGPVIKNKQILANFGVNLVLRTRSGTPFSTSSIPTNEASTTGGTRQNTTSLNGPRLPWSIRADLRVNKDFAISVGRKGEDKDPRKLYFSVFVWIQNLFNTANQISVYRYTGNPNDDGYLDAPVSQVAIASQFNPQSFRDLYRAKVNNPDNYTLPRRIFLGASFNF